MAHPMAHSGAHFLARPPLDPGRGARPGRPRGGEPVAGPRSWLVAVPAAVALLLAAVGPGVTGGGAAHGPEPALARGADYVVQPGDTLWGVARRIQPDGDVRPLVARLVAARGAEPLRPGQVLALP